MHDMEIFKGLAIAAALRVCMDITGTAMHSSFAEKTLEDEPPLSKADDMPLELTAIFLCSTPWTRSAELQAKPPGSKLRMSYSTLDFEASMLFPLS